MARIIDLSHRLVPGNQRFKLEVIQSSVEEYVPEYKVPEGEWYIMEHRSISVLMLKQMQSNGWLNG